MTTSRQAAMLRFAAEHVGAQDGRVDEEIHKRFCVYPARFWQQVLAMANEESALNAEPFAVARIRGWQLEQCRSRSRSA